MCIILSEFKEAYLLPRFPFIGSPMMSLNTFNLQRVRIEGRPHLGNSFVRTLSYHKMTIMDEFMSIYMKYYKK